MDRSVSRVSVSGVLLAGLAALIGFLAGMRFARRNGAVPPAAAVLDNTLPLSTAPLLSPDEESVHVPPASPVPAAVSGRRLLVYLIVALVCVAVLIGLQNSASFAARGLFLALVAGSVLVAAASAPATTVRIVGSIRHLPARLVVWMGSHRVGLAGVLTLIGLGFMALAALRFYTAWLAHIRPDEAFRFTLYGTLAVGAALLLNRQGAPVAGHLVSASKITPARLRRWPLLMGVLALIALTNVNLGAFPGVHYQIQFALLGAGVLLLAWGLGGNDFRLPVMTAGELMMLGGIAALALALRLWSLDTAIHRFVDEMHYVDAVTRLWNTPDMRVLVPFSEVTAFTWVYPYWQSVFVSLLGNNLFGLRALSAFVGALTVVPVYFLARGLFDRPTALLAALLLATLPPHLHFSRLALNNIADPFFGTLALAFFARGFRHGRRSDYVLGGAALGMTQYFYEGGRLLFPGLVAAWLLLCWLISRRGRTDRHAALTGLAAALIIAVPVYATLIAQGTLSPRLTKEGVQTAPDYPMDEIGLQDQRYFRVATPFLMMVSFPDQSWFYGGQEALIQRGLVPVFLLGIAVALWRLRSPGALLLVLWIGLTAAGNMLLRDPNWTPRYVVAFPALALLLAVGLRHLLALIGLPILRRPLVMAALAIAVAGGQAAYYFGEHIETFNDQFRPVRDTDDAMFRSVNFAPGTRVHIIIPSAVWEFNLSAFARYYKLDIRFDSAYPEQVTHTYLVYESRHRDVDHAFFIDPNDAETLRKIRQYFYLMPPEYSPYNLPTDKQLALFVAPRGTRPVR